MLLRKRRLIIAGVAAAIAVATFLVLVLVPVPHPFAYRNAAFGGTGQACQAASFPKGAHVSGTWEAPSTIQFYVVTCTSETIYYAVGVSGSFSFVADGSTYQFGAYDRPHTPPGAPTANVSGSYTAPLLQL